MRFGYLLLVCLLLTACKPGRKVNTSFYYWKTVYRQNNTENAYLKNLHVNKLYVRMMDVDIGDDGVNPVPVSPITFQSKLPDSIQLIPVVFIVNDALRNLPANALNSLASNIIKFVDVKVKQSGKPAYNELQIDCDWTAETRANYFYLLGRIKPILNHKTLSVTLRLHQLKNQQTSGLPPADKVLLMCYNMGNLRKYGPQNSVIQPDEFKKYAGENLTVYPMEMDIALPLFSWAVIFRDKKYIGIARRIKQTDLADVHQFKLNSNNMYTAQTDLPAVGLQTGDEVRWESADIAAIQAVTNYIAPYLKPGAINLVWFHLDKAVVKKFTYGELQNTADLLH